MSVWQRLSKTALLGTHRETVPQFTTSPTPLDQLLSQTKGETPELSLLLMAGLVTLYEENGRLPTQHVSPNQLTTPSNTRSAAPDAVKPYLNEMLFGKHSVLLSDFLIALNDAGFQLPRQYLPNLLDKGAKLHKIRPALLPVLGEVGQYLAAQNPAWHYAAADIFTWEGALRYWQANENVKRIAMFKLLREKNTAVARRLLDTQWRSVTDLTRHKLIQAMTVNISMEDEPFLEAALDDRNHLVRKNAAELLAHLPDSRFARRMRQHAQQFMGWHRGKIKVQFPETLTPAMLRDGIPRYNERLNISRFRTQQLSYLVGCTPLVFWTESWDVSVKQIVDSLGSSKWPRTILSGLTTAARRQQHQLWIEHLLIKEGFGTAVSSLIKVVDPAALQTFILENRLQFAAGRRLIERSHPARTVLYNFPHKWDEPLNKFWIQQFANYIKQSGKRKTADPQLKAMLTRLLNTIPISQTEFAEKTLLAAAKKNDKWQAPLRSMLNTVQFRREMLAAIQNE